MPAAAAIELALGARSATRNAGAFGAMVSSSATTTRIGQRMSAALRTGRCEAMPRTERAATRLCHSEPSLGRMMSSPSTACALAMKPNSPGAAPAAM
jgi:hypothetical protein